MSAAYQELQKPRIPQVAPPSGRDGLGPFLLGTREMKKSAPSGIGPLISTSFQWPQKPRSPEPRQRAAIFVEDLEKQISESNGRHHEVLIQDLRKHYVLPGDSSVRDFLVAHRTIPQILLSAVSQLKTCFGANTVFTLRAPLDESGVRTLYAVAIWSGKLSDVRAALAKFDDQWWIANSPQAEGYLVFTYELV